jgi:tetratricopeptide (TPR) repeat protein
MSVLKKLVLLVALMSSLVLALAQTSADGIGAITSALRDREFDKALQLLQPALLKSPQSAQLWTLQGIAFSGAEREKEALTSFRSALKISPDYLPALEGAAQRNIRQAQSQRLLSYNICCGCVPGIQPLMPCLRFCTLNVAIAIPQYNISN